MEQFVEYLMRRFGEFGDVTVKRMFGGYGFYYEKTIFAAIMAGELYFKVGDNNRKDFEKRGCEYFVYEGKTKPVVMPYMKLPEDVLESEELGIWMKKAVQASRKGKHA